MIDTKAVILAGGTGTRLRPLTDNTPKPMLPLKGKPILEHVIDHLKENGITDLIITLGYMGHQITDYFGDGSKFGVSIEYVKENQPLGTAGCLNLIRDKLTETFLLVGADNVTHLDLKKFINFHREKCGLMTVALFEFNRKVEFGIYELGEGHRISQFKEKPTYTHTAGTMIFCIEPDIFNHIPKSCDTVLNLTDHIIPELLKRGERVYGFPFSDFWVDIGNMEQYESLNRG